MDMVKKKNAEVLEDMPGEMIQDHLHTDSEHERSLK